MLALISVAMIAAAGWRELHFRATVSARQHAGNKGQFAVARGVVSGTVSP